MIFDFHPPLPTGIEPAQGVCHPDATVTPWYFKNECLSCITINAIILKLVRMEGFEPSISSPPDLRDNQATLHPEKCHT